MDVMVFMHAFAWVFVLSSLIPSVILGKERSVLIQFLVCLTLAFVSVSFTDIFSFVSAIPFFPYLGENSVEQIFEMVTCLEKPWLASLYLAVPYLTMLSVDLCEGRRKPRIGLARDEGNTEFMRFKGQGFETARENPYEAGVTTEGELMGYVERGWEVIMELSDGRYVIRRKTSVERSLISYFLRKISDSTRLKT